MARRKKRPEYAADKDLCGACGDPQIVCPSTISRFIRCCPDCTHFTKRDKEWEETKRHLAAQKSRYDAQDRAKSRKRGRR